MRARTRVVEDVAEPSATAPRLSDDALHDTLTALAERRAMTGEPSALAASSRLDR